MSKREADREGRHLDIHRACVFDSLAFKHLSTDLLFRECNGCQLYPNILEDYFCTTIFSSDIALSAVWQKLHTGASIENRLLT